MTPDTFIEGKDDEGESNPDSKDGMPIRFMKKTFFQSGVTVVLAKATCDKGYFVAISYPDGHQTVVETDSRAKAKRIASFDIFMRKGCGCNCGCTLLHIGSYCTFRR